VSGFEVGLLSVAALLIFIYAGMYVPVAIMLVSFVSVWLLRGDFTLAVKLLGLTASDTLQNYTFGVIPLFVVMGLLVSIAELGRDAFDVAEQLFRRIKGGLGVTTVVANAIFAAITGISLASAAIFTRVAVPEMLRHGYKPRFAVGVVAGSSVLGMLIPPSILFIIFGLLTDTSVGHLFVAGIMPGILLAVAYSIGIVFMARYWPSYVGGATDTRAERADEDLMGVGEMFKKVAPIMVLIVVVLGGIYHGVFTPTEADAAGALGALVIALAKRRLTWRQFWEVLMETGGVTAAISFLVIGATLYSKMLALAGLPSELGTWLSSSGFGTYAFIAVYIAVLLVLGTVVDSVSIMLIVLPLVLPTLEALQIDLIWFGVITVIGVEIGLVTPPFGLVIFAIRSTLAEQEITLNDIFLGALPFAGIMLAVLAIVIAVPWFALGLL
jgi:tripartite ATP-independent transporter DctM subunit